jgi:excisionase family DNA binding protein
MVEIKEFYTIKEFAKKLGVCPNTVRKNIKLGRILAWRSGNGPRPSYRIYSTEIQRICEIDTMKLIEEAAERIYEQKMGGRS